MIPTPDALATVKGLTAETRAEFNVLAASVGAAAVGVDETTDDDVPAVLATLIHVNHELFRRLEGLRAEIVAPEAAVNWWIRCLHENNISFCLALKFVRDENQYQETLLMHRYGTGHADRMMFTLCHGNGHRSFRLTEEAHVRRSADKVEPQFMQEHKDRYEWHSAERLERAVPHISKGAAGWTLMCVYMMPASSETVDAENGFHLWRSPRYDDNDT